MAMNASLRSVLCDLLDNNLPYLDSAMSYYWWTLIIIVLLNNYRPWSVITHRNPNSSLLGFFCKINPSREFLKCQNQSKVILHLSHSQYYNLSTSISPSNA